MFRKNIRSAFIVSSACYEEGWSSSEIYIIKPLTMTTSLYGLSLIVCEVEEHFSEISICVYTRIYMHFLKDIF